MIINRGDLLLPIPELRNEDVSGFLFPQWDWELWFSPNAKIEYVRTDRWGASIQLINEADDIYATVPVSLSTMTQMRQKWIDAQESATPMGGNEILITERSGIEIENTFPNGGTDCMVVNQGIFPPDLYVQVIYYPPNNGDVRGQNISLTRPQQVALRDYLNRVLGQ